MNYTTDVLVKQNTLRVYLYMTLLTLLIGGFGHLISMTFHFGLTGTGVALIISGLINFIAFFFSDRLILSAARANKLTPEMSPELYELVAKLCQKSGIPMPKLYLIHTSAMNAFATGRDPKHAAVAVTRGLLEKLTPHEIEGVVAHELGHVRNYDIRIMAVVAILAGLISILADIYWHSHWMTRASDQDRTGILHWMGAGMALFAPLTAMLIQLTISREREFLADASGAMIVGKAESLISALKKIAKDQTPLPHTSYAIAHLYISNPLVKDGLIDRMMSTHPPMTERISRLERLKM